MTERNVPTLPPDVFASVVNSLADTLIRDYRERWSRGGPDPNTRPHPSAVAVSPTGLKIADAAKRAQCERRRFVVRFERHGSER
jgi:hypothetical protein